MPATTTEVPPMNRNERCPEPGCDNRRGEEFPFRCSSCAARAERRSAEANR